MMKSYAAKKVPQLLRQAVDKYSEGLGALLGHETDANAKLRCALLSNRAQAHTQLDNWRNALDSAEDAIKADPTHLKSFMRAANAAVHVKEWEKVEKCCKEGLKVKPGDPELIRIREVRFSCHLWTCMVLLHIQACAARTRYVGHMLLQHSTGAWHRA